LQSQRHQVHGQHQDSGVQLSLREELMSALDDDKMPVMGWHQQQALEGRRKAAQNQQQAETASLRGYHAGRIRGQGGDLSEPPWMAHLPQLLHNPDPLRLEQFQQAHRYGQVEGFVETEPDRIQDEFEPRAQKLAQRAASVENQTANADTAYRARGLVALAGRSRYPMAPTSRRARVAHERMAGVQDEAAALHEELNGRLAHVDELRTSLDRMPWKPPHAQA
jgi:hypothetical protein